MRLRDQYWPRWATWVVIVLCCLCCFVLTSVDCGSKDSARRTATLSNLYMLALASASYAVDNDDHLPSAYVWGSAIFPYVRNQRAFRDAQLDRPHEAYDAEREKILPEANPDAVWGFAFDSRLGAKVLKQDPRRILLFRSKNTHWNANDPFLSYRITDDRKQGMISFTDGHVKAVAAARLHPGMTEIELIDGKQ